jgi:two-component system, NarL family, invasion response regulator UvrY
LNTVSTHKQSIFEKVGVSNIIDLYKKVEKQLPHLLR